jgi:hypothetical protein
LIDENKIDIAHCVHCGRIYLLDVHMGDECVCGAELYPVRRKLSLGELKLSDGFSATVKGLKNA